MAALPGEVLTPVSVVGDAGGVVEEPRQHRVERQPLLPACAVGLENRADEVRLPLPVRISERADALRRDEALAEAAAVILLERALRGSVVG
jgi:hypothetical protein